MSTRNMSQFRDNSWLANARSYGVLKSLRCSARYAKSKSKSAINLSSQSKQEQKKQKLQQLEQQQQQQQQQVEQQQRQQEEALYANVEEVLQQTEIEEDALMGNAQGQNGFEELRRYVKQGGDFSKELIFVLQERADSELIYSKSLSKLANKLNKAGREIPGSVADAWRGVATEMESRSDIHRQLAASLTDELVKPLKTVVDNHHKTRKVVESNVDKAARVLSEWRVSEAKAKKASHTAARENEKLQDAMLDVRIQKSPSIALLHQGPNKLAAEKELKSAEKDCVKLDNKRKKAEEAVKRADVEYYTLCVRAERARVDWEMAVLRGSSQLQSSEQQRLGNMHNFVQQYARLIADMNPILGSLTSQLQPQLEACNVAKDVQVVRNIRRNSEGPSEQLLPDFYCEHTTLAMNRERRKHSLIKLLQLVKTDLERERRSRDGLRGLSQSLNNQEHQNITDKLYHIRSMLTYLEGARLKLHSALLELDHKPRTTHPLAQHIQITRDRTGLQQSILKVPNWLKNNEKTPHSTTALLTQQDVSDDATAVDDGDDEYSQLQSQTNSSCANISVVAATATAAGGGAGLFKHFNRSKSNIETFTSQPKIISTTNASLANATATATATTTTATTTMTTAMKSKTLSAAGSGAGTGDRGQADGGSNQQDSDFDEFSSQDEDEAEPHLNLNHHHHNHHHLQQQQHFYQNAQEVQSSSMSSQGTNGSISKDVHTNNNGATNGQCQVLGRCKALYSYTPKLYDELELSPGDVIEVHAKQDDGWWLGALRNQIGIFPATYVEECA
ncbi:nostrin isoform X2 [Drosophila sulfurigaster albostrigata]|uniref:nostrin isoform X2 n=1 Tax=Drosophila sulfurigaster albostrigata TaxID=89887 RepID=UPI002D21BAC0|nr:nostrin isoform X2 [Drosophila sulfurigaster albostrigata]